MLKISKSNENYIKKDFFKKKKHKITEKLLSAEDNINKISFFIIDRFKEVKLPTTNNQCYILTTKRRSPADIILDLKVEEAYIFCSRINKNELEKFTKIKGIGLSERVLQKNEVLYRHISNSINIKFKNNHAKIIIFKIENNHYVLEGSGNPSVNARNEYYILSNNKKLYNLIKNTFNNA